MSTATNQDPVSEIKSLMGQFGFRPKHYLGQNFLIDSGVLEEIINVAQISPQDTILEIGPGIGTLTIALAKKAKQVVAVEKDARLLPLLKHELKDFNNVKIINADALRFNTKDLPLHYKVVANIPYYLTSHLLRNFLESQHKPAQLVLMVQKEVAERIIAQPSELSLLAISVQMFADAEIATHVSKNSFWPKPKVDSAILKITPKQKYPDVDQNIFFRVVKAGFASKRKQIHNSLSAGLQLSSAAAQELLAEAKLDPKLRPQDLSLSDWIRLYEQFKKS